VVTETAVSVIIPTYNGEKKIPGILEALKKQTHNNFEVVIVIDGSTTEHWK
jgi:glycosyltransferase EpsJ